MSDQRPDDRSVGAGGATAGGGPGGGATSDPATAGTGRRRSNGWMGLLVPAITFVVGLVLGTALMWAGMDRDDGESVAVPTPAPSAGTPTPSGEGRPDATVTVPGSCLDLADSAEGAADLVEDAATAAQDLDAAELSSIVRQMQGTRTDIQQQADDCRSGVDA